MDKTNKTTIGIEESAGKISLFPAMQTRVSALQLSLCLLIGAAIFCGSADGD